MVEIGTTIPGYKVCEYKIVLDPHSDLQTKIADVRKEFNEAYKIDKIHASKANVAFATFTQYEMMEERIVNHLKIIALGYPPFKVELRDFGSYPTHRIFINIVSKIPIQNLTKKIRSEVGRLMKLNDENKPHFFTDPYIHVASKLLPWQYEKAWQEYSGKQFTGRFIAEAMLFLKRNPTESRWQIVQRLEFQNLPVNVKQGDLFI